MERLCTKTLLSWKASKRRKPLIVRGARQVGKTWTILEFGRSHFENVHCVDLERHSAWHRIFADDLTPARILAELEILLDVKISPGQDLLFLDEIQSCPRALMSLRYFYEDCPDLHVIAAGSLLEFALQEISFPVGRVQFLDMYPMNFAEFLLAGGKQRAADIILAPPQPQPESVHAMLLDELRRYLFVGGMPEGVREYYRRGSLRDAFAVQAELINTFRQDFAKYAGHSDKRCLDSVLHSLARGVGTQVKYAHLAEDYSNPTLKKAFELLTLARIAHKVCSVNPVGTPLGAAVSPKKFKALLADIGLMQKLCGMPVDVEYAKTDLLAIYRGAMAEQFVGQEVLTAGQELYYWSREAKSSSAEVDFLLSIDGKIVPVEVKSGAAGRLRSLHLLLNSCPACPGAYIFSGAPFAELPEQKLTFLPLYYAYSAATGSTPASI